MPVTPKEKEHIKTLAQEGKRIAKIVDEDYPNIPYWEIYGIVYSSGGKSSLGVKRVIANRLQTLSQTRQKAQRNEIIEEIEELVSHLYNSLKSNQGKIDAIRKALEK